MSSKIHSVDVEKDAFSNAIPEIEILKRRKKEEIEKQQVLEIQELEKASKILGKQCLSEMNEEVLLILHAQARQLQEKKTYAQAAESAVSKPAVSKPAQNPEKTEKNTAHASIHGKVEKKMQKEKNFQISRNRRLILKVSNQDILQRNKLNSNLIFRIRNEINQQFFSQLMTDIEVQKPVIASIEPSFFGNSIILTTMPEFSAEFLIQNENLWKSAVESLLNTTILSERDEKWGKFILHDIPVEIFDCEEGMLLLKNELEEYNSIQLRKEPSKISEVRVAETQNVHSVPEITKLVSINVKHAQKEVKFVNILCLSALIVKKNMHLALKNNLNPQTPVKIRELRNDSGDKLDIMQAVEIPTFQNSYNLLSDDSD
ncbi:uncharacterized protein BDCG_17979 [Blastomyces dermatitidis ER-3]|uniref:Uncharacterized protein n=1 Tax=Ajellomyces dermatitidis (strain ER-3 / ATCC MYA-2586) TaxID=559297 RepID=A0ABX2VS70_AJEDR|nr:uncharacterized protein BDCG_16425 [Blastomyces dermatitidis ER-3]XP_045279783.1 uncharacterized protein BDCG_16440 [Blastomyces dermatitidis ER-3]XP_045279793.1 uncharacterized protein BDCG_16447 [Blastomyces dermatitidis ER-3]XP_045280455.1 uncharacterized protein BDCG_16750 [Blastomyces dermatitidis ER-3]XP_045281273.1 uncharacterized protein BDCG_17129 [Blastomyces dermatitidis ER-3]XP_045281944.1 uncharacterized protein BDCG_17442 [Blastomyces dermatitidis ER-3]XP_045282756.1 uncharac